MLLKRVIPTVLSVILLAASIVYVAGIDNTQATVITDEPIKIDVEKSQEEIRGVWVTYMALDVENEADHESAFRQRIDNIVTEMEEYNLNTMIVQVRPFSDAIYPSDYYPWSHIVTGTQGEDPGFDPLQMILQSAHEKDIRVHAWINPYRISSKNTPSALSDDNPYIKNRDMCVELNDGLFLNPASEKATELIVNGVKEIVERYDVDGIQFDDYFYPPDCGDFDKDDYQAYCENTGEPLPLSDFRKENVNCLIASVYRAVHQTKENVIFGISPQGNIRNNEKIFADVQKWCTEKGYIDYICPQIYFSLDNPALTFEEALQDWLDLKLHDSLALYVGIPAYKAGTEADSGTWLDNDDILSTELSITKEKGTDGFILYSSDSFDNEDNREEMQNVFRYLTSSPSQ